MQNTISINTFREAKILIVGDIILDHYIFGAVSRISPEAPVPVLLKKNITTGLGGAANVAANITALGGHATLLGVAGADENARHLERLLANQNIASHLLKDSSRKTTTKTRVMADQHQIVRIDEETDTDIDKHVEQKLLTQFTAVYKGFATIILSDYKKGVCTSQVCRTIIDLCRSSGIEIIVDPKGSHWQKYKNTTCITPNFTEFCAVAGDLSNDDTTIIEKASAICAELDLEHLLVTRGAKGMVMAGPGKKPLFFIRKSKRSL